MRLIAVIIFTGTLSSCFTGIESTKKIELSRQDRKQLSLSPEETFLKDFEGRRLSDMKPGERFLIADSKIALLLENDSFLSPTDRSLVGRHLFFKGIESRMRPDRTLERIILLSDSTSIYRYPTGMTPERADTSVYSTHLPMILDLENIDKIRDKLIDNTLWTQTSLWYALDGEKISGRKFSRITVVDIEPGSRLFPVKVIFTDDQGNKRMMWMNYSSTSSDSRKFPQLFSLSDRRKDYPNISDEHWSLIQLGLVTGGMTKDECRLSLGNPSDAMAGHTHSQTLDIWQYPDGTYLRFADGLLVDYRR